MTTHCQATGAGRPLRILQLSDFHLLTDPAKTMMGVNTDDSFRAVLLAACEDREPWDLVLLTGDLVQEPTPEAYRRLKGHLQGLDAPIFCLPGNHDELELMSEMLLGGSIGMDTQILVGDWQIVCLDTTVVDSPGGFLPPQQMDRLREALESQPRRYTLVCLHHSPVATGSEWLDTMWVGNAEEFLELLSHHPQVKAVIFGHVHQEMDTYRDSLRLMACPSTCFQFKPENGDFALDALPPGYRWLILHPDGRFETGVERLRQLPAGLDMASGGY